MSMTTDEIIEKLLDQYDVDDILILLDIQGEELLWHFDFKIDEHYDKVIEAIDDGETTQSLR